LTAWLDVLILNLVILVGIGMVGLGDGILGYAFLL
jgi:hypothetical protein